MKHQSKHPFQDMSAVQWLNLAVVALICFFTIYLILEVVLRTMCGQLGLDYCDYISAGRVANSYGYVKIYDIELLDRVQKGLLPPTADPSSIPVDIFPYLPVFVLPFQALAFLSPEVSFWIWTPLKVAALLFYLRFFARKLGLDGSHVRFMLLMFASLPVMQNIFSGQVDVWLMICVGEFMRALLGRRPFQAGLWLGGLLLKPQVLVVLVLFLLLWRSARVLMGLVVSSLLILAASVALIGPAGIHDLVGLWLLYFKGHPSNLVEGMMNWRMVGLEVAQFTNAWIGYGITGTGIILTLGLCVLSWRHSIDLASPDLARPLLGILAATTMVAWHAHIFMAMILIPPLMYLYCSGRMPEKVLGTWILLPAFIYLVSVFVPEAMTKFNLAVDHLPTAIYVVLGLAQFLVNSYLFWWSAGPDIGFASPAPLNASRQSS